MNAISKVTEASNHMNLPKYKVVGQGPALTNITLECGNCGGRAKIDWQRLHRQIKGRHTAICMYCFKAGRLPNKRNQAKFAKAKT